MSKGLEIDCGKFPYPIIAIIEATTGIPAESWTETYLIPSDTDIDIFAQAIADENAASFGKDEIAYCRGCGELADIDSDYCDSCGDTELEYQPNEDICGILYKYQPSKSGDYVNGGEPISTVVEWLFALKIITSPVEGSAVVDVNKLSQTLHIETPEDIEIIRKELARKYRVIQFNH